MLNSSCRPVSRESITTSTWGEWRVTLAFFIIFSLFVLNMALSAPNAYALPASTPRCSQDPAHCYGVIDWPNHTNGSWTDIGVRGVGGGNYAVTHEMWLTDLNSHNVEQCYAYPHDPTTNGPCWVEGGYVTTGPLWPHTQGEFWFWADVRPGGEGYFVHYAPLPLQPGDYGHFAEVYIFNAQHNIENWNFCPNTYDEFCVVIQGNASSMYGVSGSGNSNWMYPDLIQIGVEYIA